MADDLKRVGLVFKEDGAVDFKKTLQEVNLELNKNYNQFKLTQAQWDNSTKSTEKLRAEQEYLKNAYEIQTDKVNTLKMQLSDLENAEEKNTTAIKKKRNELTNAEIKLETYNNRIKEIESQLNNTGKKIEEFGTKIENVGDKTEKAGKKLSAFSAASATALVISTKTAIDFEDAFAGVEKTVDGTAEQMEELKQGIKDMAKEIPSTTTEISAVAEAAGQLGIKTENILDFTKVMIDLGNSTNLSAEEAASSLAKFANVTKMSADDYSKLGSTVVALGNNFATTEADIVAMAQNLASAGTQVGMSQSDIMALATALSSVGLEAQAGGTAFSKALTKIQLAVETNSEGLKDWADVAGMSVTEFSDLFKKDATSALEAFIKGLSECGGETESAIKVLDDMGITETRMRDALLRSANASDIFSEAIELGSEAWEDNTALTNEANKRYETLKSKITMAVNKLKDMAIAIGNKLMPHIEKIIDKFGKWIEKFESLSDEQVNMIVKIGLIVAAIGPLVTILGKVTSTIGGTIKGIGTFTQAIGAARGNITSTSEAVNGLAGIMKNVFSPTGIAIGAIIAGAAILNSATTEARKYAEECETGLEKTLQEKKAIDELRTSIEDNMQSQLTEIDTNKLLWEELQKITDENGKIKEGYENRAKVITGQLAESLGVEISITDGVIDKYKELQEEIDKLIIKKQAEIILSASEEKYAEAIKKRSQKTQELIDKEEEYNNSIKNRDSVYDTLTESEKKYYEAMKKGEIAYLSHQEMLSLDLKKIINLQELDKTVSILEKDTQTLTDTVNDYTKDIQDYQYNLQLSTEGTTEALNKMIDSVSRTHKSNGENIKTTYAEMISEQQLYNKTAKKSYDEAVKDLNKSEMEKSQYTMNESNKRIEQLIEELISMTSITEENTPDIVEAWKTLATDSYDVYSERTKKLPFEMRLQIQKMTGVVSDMTPNFINVMDTLSMSGVEALDKDAEFKEKAIESLNGYLKGMTDEEKRKLLTEAGIENIDLVMSELENGNLSKEQGENILKGLYQGLESTQFRNNLLGSAANLAGKLTKMLSINPSITASVAGVSAIKANIPGHKLGLDYVPKDNYVARLHKGERVLTAEENETYMDAEKRNEKKSSNYVMNTSQEINYNKMADAFLSALNKCKLTLDEDGFAKLVRNELYEVI